MVASRQGLGRQRGVYVEWVEGGSGHLGGGDCAESSGGSGRLGPQLTLCKTARQTDRQPDRQPDSQSARQIDSQGENQDENQGYVRDKSE